MTDRKKIEQAKTILLMGQMAMANFNIDPNIIDDDAKEFMKNNLASLMGELAVALNLKITHQKKAAEEINVAAETFFDMLKVPN